MKDKRLKTEKLSKVLLMEDECVIEDEHFSKAVDKISSKDMDAILRIQSCALKTIHDFMYEKKVLQLMPVMLSPITDPLCHSVYDASISYCGQKLQLTKSMILHKQMALISPERKAIYIVSPNIRLEKEDSGKSRRHLIEFSQVDFEFKDWKTDDVFKFMEELMVKVISRVKEECKDELKMLGRTLIVPKTHFKRFSTKDAKGLSVRDFEERLSSMAIEPFWLLDHEREFYDKEHPEKPRTYLNYDLIYPEGFGEALSGGEREHEYEKIIERMKRSGVKPEHFKGYITLAKHGLLHKTAGAGFGVERLVRFLTGKTHVADVALFGKTPGEKFVF